MWLRNGMISLFPSLMTAKYRIVVLLTTGSSYVHTFLSKEERDTEFVALQNAVNAGVGTFVFDQDIPSESSILRAQATICVPRVVSIETQDVKVSD